MGGQSGLENSTHLTSGEGGKLWGRSRRGNMGALRNRVKKREADLFRGEGRRRCNRGKVWLREKKGGEKEIDTKAPVKGKKASQKKG